MKPKPRDKETRMKLRSGDKEIMRSVINLATVCWFMLPVSLFFIFWFSEAIAAHQLKRTGNPKAKTLSLSGSLNSLRLRSFKCQAIASDLSQTEAEID